MFLVTSETPFAKLTNLSKVSYNQHLIHASKFLNDVFRLTTNRHRLFVFISELQQSVSELTYR